MDSRMSRLKERMQRTGCVLTSVCKTSTSYLLMSKTVVYVNWCLSLELPVLFTFLLISVSGNMVVHFMLPESREVYELEKLWTLRTYDEQLKSIPADTLPKDFIYDAEVTKWQHETNHPSCARTLLRLLKKMCMFEHILMVKNKLL